MTQYQQFLANGGDLADWDAHLAEANAKFHQEGMRRIVRLYHGEGVRGLDLVNTARAVGLLPPKSVLSVIQHEDTVIQRGRVTGRLSRRQALAIHEWAYIAAGKLTEACEE